MNYGTKLSDVMMAKLAKKLQDKGISLLGRWDSKAPTYGYNTVEKTVHQYVITLDSQDVTSYARATSPAVIYCILDFYLFSKIPLFQNVKKIPKLINNGIDIKR